MKTIKHSYVWVLLALAPTISTHVNANWLTGEPTYQSQWSNPQTPLVIDAASPGEAVINKTGGMGKVMYILITNIPPKASANYQHNISYQEVRRAALVRPQVEAPVPIAKPEDTPKPDGGVAGIVAAPKSCVAILTPLINELSKAETPAATASLLKQIIAVPPNDESGVHNDSCVGSKNRAVEITQRLIAAPIEKGQDLIFTFNKVETGGSTQVAKFTLKQKVKEWITHAGWTFIGSRDTLHYSVAGEDGTYTVQRQGNQPSINHALTVAYIYPLWTWGDDFHIGPSGMLGLGQNGLLVGAGVSLAFTENFSVSISVIASEFKQLNGVYKVGQNVGTTALDSTTLDDDAIKASGALTIGFRF
ncbi:hypothetical protein [Rheinheimera hassiensis]|uniref:hypothetical protein n=1 Tax=Rheinheimera hassiensis TaxID=1193627 RepID=UPI001F057DA7|nr:hypothetical protein [Rheinheimera hassiensis]